MSEDLRILCHGLGVVQPIDQLGAFLHEKTGLTFSIAGGADPQLEEGLIRNQVQRAILAKQRVIFIGHSKGAMLAFYLSNFSPDLIVAIDPTCWGSNVGAPAWDLFPPKPGCWQSWSKKKLINIHQAGYPGGGHLTNPGLFADDHFFPDSDHMSIVNDPRTRDIVLKAVREACQ